MKRVAILTITDGQNYGNRLQNYAMQTVLQHLDCKVETMRRKTSRDLPLRKKIKHELKELAKRALGRTNTEIGRSMRKRAFNRFNQRHIRFSKVCLHDNQAPKGIDELYDFFVCGSDQIWNARIKIVEEDIKNYLAFFARSEQKIAYAASFGTNDIAEGYENLFAEQLPTFSAIGVRENSGVEVVRKCCGRSDAEVVLDPTMMLTTDEWNEIAEKPTYIEDRKYIVTYFLGGRSPKISNYINRVCDRYGAEAINLDIEFLQDNRIEDKRVFATSPSEFIWLISHAECVLTDSFHACVFAILYNKPFCVFQRVAAEKGNDMGSRIDTLLGRFMLERFQNDIDKPELFPEPYAEKKIQDVLKSEREKSMLYLKESLTSNEN